MRGILCQSILYQIAVEKGGEMSRGFTRLSRGFDLRKGLIRVLSAFIRGLYFFCNSVLPNLY